LEALDVPHSRQWRAGQCHCFLKTPMDRIHEGSAPRDADTRWVERCIEVLIFREPAGPGVFFCTTVESTTDVPGSDMSAETHGRLCFFGGPGRLWEYPARMAESCFFFFFFFFFFIVANKQSCAKTLLTGPRTRTLFFFFFFSFFSWAGPPFSGADFTEYGDVDSSATCTDPSTVHAYVALRDPGNATCVQTHTFSLSLFAFRPQARTRTHAPISIYAQGPCFSRNPRSVPGSRFVHFMCVAPDSKNLARQEGTQDAMRGYSHSSRRRLFGAGYCM
jgi:hypothetical protein